MISAQPRIYYNSGFRVGEIPDRKALLDSLTYRDLDVHVGLQDLFLQSFKLKIQWDDIKNADYMKYGAGYYWIKPVMENENCCTVYCVRDDLTTLGGPLALQYIGGTIQRAHPLANHDNYAENVVQENIGCSEILVAKRKTSSFIASQQTVKVIASTVKLNDPNVSLSPTQNHDGLVFSSQITVGAVTEDYAVVVPKTPEPAEPTIISAFGSTGIETTGYGLYNANNSIVKKNLEYIRALGLSDAILFSYEIPAGVVSVSYDSVVGSGDTAGAHIDAMSTNQIQDPGAGDWGPFCGFGIAEINAPNVNTLKNRKTFMTNRAFVIRGRLSGDMKTYEAPAIYSSATSSFEFVWNADPQQGGTTYCGPLSYYNNTDSYYRIGNSVKGLPWKETPISFNGASGSLWARNQMAQGLAEATPFATLRETGSGFTGFINELAGVGARGIATNVIGLGQSIASLAIGQDLTHGINANMTPDELQRTKHKAAYAQSQVVAPVLTTSPALGMQTFIDNSFDVFQLSPSSNDTVNIDNFYTLYGYAQGNKPFKKEYMNSRNDFNYIETSGVRIARDAVAGQFGNNVVSGAEAQLEGGVRIWHVLPHANIL